MFEWFEALTALQKVFAVFATFGSTLFVIRMVMMFAGMDGESDGDVDGDLDGDMDGDAHGDHADANASDISFSLLSFQGLTAFFMMFGLVGLAMSKGSGFGAVASIPVATAAGLSTVWIISRLFKLFNSLQSSGTLNLKSAIGQEGKVYLTIPENESGQVQLAVQGHLKVMSAVSEDKRAIPSDALVKVVGLVGGNVLVVKKK
jgi:hypothetical protein